MDKCQKERLGIKTKEGKREVNVSHRPYHFVAWIGHHRTFPSSKDFVVSTPYSCFNLLQLNFFFFFSHSPQDLPSLFHGLNPFPDSFFPSQLCASIIMSLDVSFLLQQGSSQYWTFRLQLPHHNEKLHQNHQNLEKFYNILIVLYIIIAYRDSM